MMAGRAVLRDLYNIKKCLLTKTEINDINLYSKGHNKRGDQKKSFLSLSRCFLYFFSLYFDETCTI